MNRSSGLAFLDLHPFVRQTVLDRARGTIFGGALGDAIGLYTEFLSRDLSLAAYPERKFQLVEPATDLNNDRHRNKFDKTSWTDDTDHALLIVLSYLHSNGELDPTDFAQRLRFWVEQGLRCLNRLPLGLGKTVGSVVCDPTFVQDPTGTAYRHWRKSNCSAAPNGSLMRTYPLGVICLGKTLEETFQIATDYSAVTHADPRCIVSCCLVTGLIRGILRGEVENEHDIDQMVESSLAWMEGWILRQNSSQHTEESQDRYPALDRAAYHAHVRAETFEELQLDDARTMGYVYKTLGAGIFLLRKGIRHLISHASSDGLFEKLITDLVLQGGDADTNAAVAGSLLGALIGYSSLPGKWKLGVMHSPWLLAKCAALASVSGIYPSSPYDGKSDPDTGLKGGKPRLTREELEQRELEFVERYMTKSAQKVNGKKQGWVRKLLRR